MKTKSNLRKMMAEKLVAAPGVYNALSARMAEAAGFEAIYLTGFGTAAVNHAFPDIGLITMSEMLHVIRAITGAVAIPLIADGDTGYGNALNVRRAIMEYERAGAGAIHLEDQVWPKRCGHMEGKQVIPVEEMTAKIRSALDNRQNPDFIVIARTDALAVEGFSSAIDRLGAYAEAGADVVFMDGQATLDHMRDMPGHFTRPCMINMGPLTPDMSVAELEALGYRLAVFPAACLGPAFMAVSDALASFARTGRQPELGGYVSLFKSFNRFVGLDFLRDLEKEYKSGGTL